VSNKRHHADFLTSYLDYADDKFCPPEFHKWVGLSVIAAALERKISLKQGKISHTPNIYTMLVSHPAVGKSTAMEAGTDLIEAMRKDYNSDFRIIPNQATEPALIDMMKEVSYFPLSPTLNFPHSSGFFYASEASASALQNTCGDFIAAMTHFYDCPKFFRKKLKGEQHVVEIENACMNLLAGATFDYLKNLVNEQSVMGGFASRLIYVVSKERKVREIKWGASIEYDMEKKQKLIEDLAMINKLAGPVRATTGFTKRYEEWQPEFDRYLIGLKSSRMESIMSRKGTNMIKLAMILSVSERSDLIVDETHFDRARELIDDVTKDNAFIISSAIIADKTSQGGLNQLIAQTLAKAGGTLSIQGLKKAIVSNGNDLARLEVTMNTLVSAGQIVYDGLNVRLLVDPNINL